VLHLMEETATPELEQVGLLLASQELPGGGSQQQQPLVVMAVVMTGGQQAAAAAAGGGGRSSAQQQQQRQAAAAAAAAAAGGSGRGGGAPGGSSARGAGVVCEEVTTKQVLFPIFRPKSQRKCVILVRHGESTYNKQDAHGRAWADPTIFDAPLTARGRQQVRGEGGTRGGGKGGRGVPQRCRCAGSASGAPGRATVPLTRRCAVLPHRARAHTHTHTRARAPPGAGCA
jgi:hypothetical protein